MAEGRIWIGRVADDSTGVVFRGEAEAEAARKAAWVEVVEVVPAKYKRAGRDLAKAVEEHHGSPTRIADALGAYYEQLPPEPGEPSG